MNGVSCFSSWDNWIQFSKLSPLLLTETSKSFNPILGIGNSSSVYRLSVGKHTTQRHLLIFQSNSFEFRDSLYPFTFCSRITTVIREKAETKKVIFLGSSSFTCEFKLVDLWLLRYILRGYLCYILQMFSIRLLIFRHASEMDWDWLAQEWSGGPGSRKTNWRKVGYGFYLLNSVGRRKEFCVTFPMLIEGDAYWIVWWW